MNETMIGPLHVYNPKRQKEAMDYLDERSGRPEWRFIRYGAVADLMFEHGLNDTHMIMDVGSGSGDFDFYLRAVRNWRGRYLPVDASIDGIDLELVHRFGLPAEADFVTCIETIEHVASSLYVGGLLSEMEQSARQIVVLTTPNTEHLGEQAVREMDTTHVRPVWASELVALGYSVQVEQFFGKSKDSILAWRYGRAAD